MPFNLGLPEIILILAIVLIIFGVGRLPEVGGAMGKAIREFRREQSGVEETKPASSETKPSSNETKGPQTS